ncbi:MAG: PEGA domain-containing protein, partial [Treponema sp.]|nr:PEGA domain-containing protein [Treponema sp.]
MKPRFAHRAFLCFFLIAGAGLFARESYQELAGRGLYVNSEPSGAQVFINGIERGKTPFTLDTLRAGEYSVRVVKEGYLERRFTV